MRILSLLTCIGAAKDQNPRVGMRVKATAAFWQRVARERRAMNLDTSTTFSESLIKNFMAENSFHLIGIESSKNTGGKNLAEKY